MLSLDNICPIRKLLKSFYKLIPRIQLTLLGSTNSNFGEYRQVLLCFIVTYYFSIEHKPLFIPTEIYFIKRHVWTVKKFHKTNHKAWNIFKRLELLSKNSAEIQFSRVTINQEESSIDRKLFLIDQIGIEYQSN